MRSAWQIAWRYLFSKKGHNAINIVSGVSAAAVCVVTAAMICVLSVMNGFGNLVEQMFSEFDPDIRITSAIGKSFSTDSPAFQSLPSLPYVATMSEQVSETALIQYKDHRMPAKLMGVDGHFQELTHIDSIITDGCYSVYDGAFERAVLGQGLASQLGMNAHFVGGIHIYAPKRVGKVNLMRPDESFQEASAFIAGTFAVNQTEYDDQLMLVSIDLARDLFQYDSLTVTSLGLRLQDDVSVQVAKKDLKARLGEAYTVADRYEQQEDFFRILKIEKLLTALLLVFILLIASFNVIGSLSMLILDKKADIEVLYNLGADNRLIRRIFLYEGWLVSSLGALSGIVIGLAVCLLQQHFGFLKLGNGTEYIISAYPVTVEVLDVVFVTMAVLILGFGAAWLPARKISMNHEKDTL